MKQVRLYINLPDSRPLKKALPKDQKKVKNTKLYIRLDKNE